MKHVSDIAIDVDDKYFYVTLYDDHVGIIWRHKYWINMMF